MGFFADLLEDDNQALKSRNTLRKTNVKKEKDAEMRKNKRREDNPFLPYGIGI